MKKMFPTTAIITGLFLLMTSVAVFANVPANVHKVSREAVQREIIRSISCPDFVTTNSDLNKVKAIVEVDLDGNIRVAEINSGNTELKDYVIAQLKHLKVNTTGSAEKFVLVINFKVA